MQTIDIARLVHVTGGAGCAPQQQEAAAPEASDAGGAPQGAGFMAGLEQFLGFFQSQGFQQVIGGLRQLLAGQGQPQAQGGE